MLFLELTDDVIFFVCGRFKSGFVATLSDLGIPVVLLVLVLFGVIDVQLTMVGFFLIVLNYIAMFHMSQTWDDSEFTLLNMALKSLCYFPYPAQNYLQRRENTLEALYKANFSPEDVEDQKYIE